MPKNPGQAAIRLLRDGGGCVEFSRFVAALVPSCHWELQCRRAGKMCRRVVCVWVCVCVVYSPGDFSIIGDSYIKYIFQKIWLPHIIPEKSHVNNQNLPSLVHKFMNLKKHKHLELFPLLVTRRFSGPFFRGRDLLSAKLLRSSFDRLDENGDGFVSRAELQRLLERAGSKLAQAQCLGFGEDGVGW